MTTKPPVVAIIQARLNSTRFPNKVLMPLPEISNVSTLERIANRVKLAELPDNIVVACPMADAEVFYRLLKGKCGVFFWPDESDVLSRFTHIILNFAPMTVFARITADCPCVLPEIIDLCIKEHIEQNADYTAIHNDIQDDTRGDGLDVEVFSGQALLETVRYRGLSREHVCPALYGSKIHKIHRVKIELPNVKLSIDNKEDYQNICNIYKAIGPTFSKDELFAYLEKSGGLV